MVFTKVGSIVSKDIVISIKLSCEILGAQNAKDAMFYGAILYTECGQKDTTQVMLRVKIVETYSRIWTLYT